MLTVIVNSVAMMQCATDLAALASSIVGMPFNQAAWWPVRAMAGAFLTPLLVGIGLAIKTNTDEGKQTWPWEDRGYCEIWDDISLDNFGKTNLSAGSTNSITGEFVGYYRACCNPQCSVCGGVHCGQGLGAGVPSQKSVAGCCLESIINSGVM